jgi:hypothetical protein
MGLHESHARMWGICGVITVLLLFAVSCGSNSTIGGSKSVSSTHDIRGTVIHDTNNNRVIDGNDHAVYNVQIDLYRWEGVPPYWHLKTTVYSDVNGHFAFLGLDDYYDYRIYPMTYPPDYNTYDPNPQEFPNFSYDHAFVFWGYSS